MRIVNQANLQKKTQPQKKQKLIHLLSFNQLQIIQDDYYQR